LATAEEAAYLRDHRADWAATVHALLAETEEALASARRLTGEEREQVVADLADERARLAAALARATKTGAEADDEPGELALQASWSAPFVVVWGGGRGIAPASPEELDELLEDLGAATAGWAGHEGVMLPTGVRAHAVCVPIDGALGWLVGVGAGSLAAEDVGASLQWLGDVAVWATELVAAGRMAPVLRARRGRRQAARRDASDYVVEWVPAALDRDRLRHLSEVMPGAVGALMPGTPADQVCRSVLTASVDAVCRAGAKRLVAPATGPVARTRSEVVESFLAGLDGTPFKALDRPATDLATAMKEWAKPVVAETSVVLVLRLDPPEDNGGWQLTVEAIGVGKGPLPVREALADPSPSKAREAGAQLDRLERLVPALQRPTLRRGEVVLGGDEAWEMMTELGPVVAAAGFDVRVPPASRLRPSARLHLHVDAIKGDSQVGARQLANVRWSAFFDDLELTAADITRLAAEARPLVRVKGKWVELDKADLDAAARALEDRADVTRMSGAEILRLAVGLEGAPVSVGGSGWAVDLVRGATEAPPTPLPAPAGFNGELRSYQAEARGWLAFLDRAGLGGCLAMDMGLGKTPTVLAHVLETKGDGPVLVIAPPAVLGNWAEEARRFTPGLRVHTHHGASRADDDELAKVAVDADVVLTTFGTAVRDVEALAAIEWFRVVVDEAQWIKNPASDTAQQLRRIPARSRLALTGTPIENGLGDLWSILDFTNPGLVGPRTAFVESLSGTAGAGSPAEHALRALNGLLLFRRTKAEPAIAAELPDKIDEVDHCGMTAEQIGLYQAVLDDLLAKQQSGYLSSDDSASAGTANVLAAITKLKQICNHPAAFLGDDAGPLEGRSGKLARLDELVDNIFDAGEKVLVFTHFAQWGEKLARHLTERKGVPVACYHGGLTRPVRDRLVREFQQAPGAGALVLSIKAGGSGLNLTAANHVVLYDRWWNPAVEDQARDRAWRIGQENTVVCHRLVCPGTVDERVEEVVAGKRRVADLVLPARSTLGDLSPDQLRAALGLRPEAMADETSGEEAAA